MRTKTTTASTTPHGTRGSISEPCHDNAATDFERAVFEPEHVGACDARACRASPGILGMQSFAEGTPVDAFRWVEVVWMQGLPQAPLLKHVSALSVKGSLN